MAERTYGVREFAELAGVTVRTLHHYDRLGLLRPTRTASRYRRYRTADLLRLEQIVALRYIGVPLARIAPLLGESDLSTVLAAQRRALEAKRGELDRAIEAVAAAEAAGGEAAHLTRIIEVMQMDRNNEWMLGYFSEAGRAKVEAGKREWTPELQAKAEQDWADLFRDVEAALGEDPAGDAAQALVSRWNALVEAFTKGDWQVSQGVAALWKDQANWPPPARDRMARFRNPAVWEFIRLASAAQSPA
ncbi:MAG: MerR family transcriptional regulator [Bryobacteraceae bacterium]